MRVSYLLLMVVTTVAVSMASFVPAAVAQHTVEVVEEESDTPCGAFAMSEHRPVEGNCTVQFSGSLEFYFHSGLSEILAIDCDYQFEAVFNSIGFGYLYNQTLSPEGTGLCMREPCDEGAGGGGTGTAPHRNLPWEAQINEIGSGAETVRVVMCLRIYSTDPATEGTPGTTCVVDLGIETSGHNLELVTEPDFQGNGGSVCVNFSNQQVEVEGSFVSEHTETHTGDIEIRHLDD